MPVKTNQHRSEDPLHRLWHAITRPPYAAIPWLVFLYAVISCLVYTDNGPFTGHIVGFDDQTRMTQVLNLVNGAGWYDRLMTRVNAPEGFQSIWARIVDIPIALVVIIAQQFTDQKSAALIASVILPMIELALMFLTMRYFARPIAGKQEARLTILFLMFTTVLNHKAYTLAGFHLGEASHHAWYGILNVLMFGAAVRIVLGVAGWSPKIMLGLAIALLLAVGIEGFPMIGGMVGVLSILSWSFQNRLVARRGAEAVAIGSLLTLLLLPLHVPPSEFFDVSFSQPSIMGPLITAIAAIFLLAQSYIQKKVPNRIMSGILLVIIAGLFASALIAAFPVILAGGTAGLSPNERKLAAVEHPEVHTLISVAIDNIDYIGLLMPMLIALATGIAAMATTGNTRRRMMFGAYTGFAAVPSGLTQIYWRYIHHTQTAICPLLLHAWQKIRARLPRNIFYGAASLLIFTALGPFWMVLLPAWDTNAPFLTQILFFPAKIYTEPYACDALTLTNYLNKHYDPQTLIIVPDWDSATFLYETNLRIDFLSNYPSHDHFIDNKLFFQTQNVDEAKQIAQRHKFNLVAICSWIPMAPEVEASRKWRGPAMIERLKEGSQPAWLKPVVTGINTQFKLFEIDPTALAKGP